MQSYLIVAPQGLGDALEATPLIAALKRARPDARIDVAVLRSGPRELFAGLPDLVDDVLYYPYWESGVATFAGALARSYRRRRYDVSLLAYPAARPEYHALAWLHGATTRVAHAYWPGGLSHLQWLHTELVPVAHKHNVMRNLDLLRAVGISADGDIGYAVPPAWRSGGSRSMNRIAIHVGTVRHHGLERKRWPIARFAELALRLVGRGHEVRVITGPDERAESRRIVTDVPGAKIFEGSLADVARFLGECGAAVTNDSGIGHLAAAVGTPVIALHGPTPVEGGPFGVNAVRMRPSSCPACFDPRRRNTTCALNIDYACLKRDMTVEAVDARLNQLLAQKE